VNFTTFDWALDGLVSGVKKQRSFA